MKIGARASLLSQAQVAEIIRMFPHIRFEPFFIETRGDFNKQLSLRDMGRTNFFTDTLDTLVWEKKLRLAVHSAKDLPDPLPLGLKVIGFSQGLDPRDCVVLRQGELLNDLPPRAIIATSSVRREENFCKLRSDLSFVDVRGTIDERLAKLDRREADGVIVAEAALIRLQLTHLNRYFLPGPTAPRQGQLALVGREDDLELIPLFSSLEHTSSRWNVLYLGLDVTACPSKGSVYHYPVIRTQVRSAALCEIKSIWSQYTHIIVTSKSAALYLSHMCWDGKIVLAIGEGTASVLRKFNVNPLIASCATQEGMAAFMEGKKFSNASFLWPHSSRSRPFLTNYAKKKNLDIVSIDLYDTFLHQAGAPPPLDAIDEIVFMSPSCVEGFFAIYKTMAPHCKLTVQGPVTQAALEKYL